MATAKLTIQLDGVPTAMKSLADMRNAAQKLEEELATADFGSKKFDEIAAQLAKVKSALKQVDETTDGLSMEAKAGAIGGAVSGLAASFAVAEGAAALFGSESEQLQKTMVKVQAAMAVAGGVQQLAAGLAQAQKAMTAFGIATKSAMGPIAIFLAAAAAIAAGLLLMRDRTTAAAKAQEAYGDALKAQAPALATARIELDKTVTALKATAAGTQERSDALEELQKQYPEYISNIDKEKAKTGELSEVIDIATQAMERKIRMQAAADVAQKAMTTQIEAELELRNLATKAGLDYDKFLVSLAASGAETDNVFERLGDNITSFTEGAQRGLSDLVTGGNGKIGFVEANAQGQASYRALRAAQDDVRAALRLSVADQEADTAAKQRAAAQNLALANSLKKLEDMEKLRQVTIRIYQQDAQDAAANEQARFEAENRRLQALHEAEARIFEDEQRMRDARMRDEDAQRAIEQRNRKEDLQETKQAANDRLQAQQEEADARQAAHIAMAEQVAQAGLQIASGIDDLLNQMDANRMAALDAQMQAEQALIAKTDQALSDSAARQKTLEGDLAHASVDQRNKVLHLMDLEAAKRNALLAQKDKEAKEEARLEAEKKKIALQQFKRNQKFQEAEVAINAASAVIKQLADAPFPLNLILSVAAGVDGVLQEQKIASQQPPSFAAGGFTGFGFGPPDSSGYRVAGVVHQGEYVIPQSIVQSPQYQPLIQQVEMARVSGRGYAGGGSVGFGQPVDMSGTHDRLDTLNTRIEELAKRPVYVEIRKVNAAQQEVSATEARARL